MSEVIEVDEFEPIGIAAERLLVDGRLTIDKRIAERGYLSVSISQGEVQFRADRYVGLIPITQDLSIRVRPRAKIAGLARLIAGSGIPPRTIEGFSRGYLPKVEISEQASTIFEKALVDAAMEVGRRGLTKSYVPIQNPPPWRGRLLVSQTIAKHRARNIRYRQEFDVQNLTTSNPANQSIKRALALLSVDGSARDPDRRSRLKEALSHFQGVAEPHTTHQQLARAAAHEANWLKPAHAYYEPALWAAYMVLQQGIPEVNGSGFVRLESLIVDVSQVFEGFMRNRIRERSTSQGWTVVDGNKSNSRLFRLGDAHPVKPDIVIEEDGKPIAVFDVKYKIKPKESDRYELISFMEALGVRVGGFICPSIENEHSRHIGVTLGDKSISVLRFDLSRIDLDSESDRLFDNICAVVFSRPQDVY